jgi:hypothetical protein
MIEFGGAYFYLDLSKLNEIIILPDSKEGKDVEKVIETTYDENNKITKTKVIETSNDKDLRIDSTKYDIIRTMVDVLLSGYENDEDDDSLGLDRALSKTPLSYKIAFNTLYNYGILKEVE